MARRASRTGSEQPPPTRQLAEGTGGSGLAVLSDPRQRRGRTIPPQDASQGRDPTSSPAPVAPADGKRARSRADTGEGSGAVLRPATPGTYDGGATRRSGEAAGVWSGAHRGPP